MPLIGHCDPHKGFLAFIPQRKKRAPLLASWEPERAEEYANGVQRFIKNYEESKAQRLLEERHSLIERLEARLHKVVLACKFISSLSVIKSAAALQYS
jgi:hypothetical protein